MLVLAERGTVGEDPERALAWEEEQGSAEERFLSLPRTLLMRSGESVHLLNISSA